MKMDFKVNSFVNKNAKEQGEGGVGAPCEPRGGRRPLPNGARCYFSPWLEDCHPLSAVRRGVMRKEKGSSNTYV